MTALSPPAIRLFCDLALRNQTPVDLNTGQPPLLFRGDDVEIDIGIGAGGALLAPTLSNITSVTCQVFQKQNDPGAPLMSATVPASAMNLALTQTEWTSNTTPFYHAAFLFPNSQTCISLNALASQNYWLRVTLATADSTPKTITLLDGPVTVKDGPVSATPPAPLGNARFWTDNNGVWGLQIRNDSDGKFYPVGIKNINGVPDLYLGDTGY